MKPDEYLHSVAARPTFCGQGPNQGRIVVGPAYPGEGYAVLKCGGTEVILSYTVLHNMTLDLPSGFSPLHPMMCAAQRAIHAIACEASIKSGDTFPKNDE